MSASPLRGCLVALTLGLLIAGSSSRAKAQMCEVAGIDEFTLAEPVPRDNFATSVCISGDVALIGASMDSEAAAHGGAAYVFRSNGYSWVEEAKLCPSDVSAHMSFGASLSVSGDVALIGTISGGAYVFRFDGSDWRQESKLVVASWGFGHSVAIDGDVAVVGAYGDDGAGEDAGAAYVFRFDGSRWIEEARLEPSDVAEGDFFGYSVGISGNAIVVGARYHGGAGNHAGAMYMFRFDGNSWYEEAKVAAATGGGAGFSVCIEGNVSATGTPWSNRVYVYRYDGSEWLLDAELTIADATAEDHFGWSVSVSSNVVIASVIAWNDAGDYYQRPTIVFLYEGSTWTEQARLFPSESALITFGWSVCVSNGLAIIGEPGGHDDVSLDGYKSAYEFCGLSDCNANGVLDLCDIADGAGMDADNDGVLDGCDPCPNDNPDDSDGDGICDSLDNCPNDSNPLQEDVDGNGIGDACDEPDLATFPAFCGGCGSIFLPLIPILALGVGWTKLRRWRRA